MQNGFYHEYPYSQDVAVSPEMEQALNGRQHIDARVQNSRYDAEQNIVADCVYEGHIYTVKSCSFLEQSYWLLIA